MPSQDVCPCHGEPWYQDRAHRRCHVKAKAAWRSATKTYEATTKGLRSTERKNDNRRYKARAQAQALDDERYRDYAKA